MCSKRTPATAGKPRTFPLQIVRADARTRTGDPFITSVDQASPQVARGRAKSHGSEELARPRWRPKTENDKRVDPAQTRRAKGTAANEAKIAGALQPEDSRFLGAGADGRASPLLTADVR
jgi:hypothetical protein